MSGFEIDLKKIQSQNSDWQLKDLNEREKQLVHQFRSGAISGGHLRNEMDNIEQMKRFL